MQIKELLKRSKHVKSLLHALRLAEYKRKAQALKPPFNGDRIMAQLVDYIINKCNVSSFIETGTYLGQTCRYIASRHPNLPLITIENSFDYYYAAERMLRKFANVRCVLGDSAVTVSELTRNDIKGVPIFFLDAHWNDYLPLPDEIYSIGNHLNDAIMVIHDFNVPGMDYGFDVCNGKMIGVEMLAVNICKDKSYQVYCPCYTYEQAYGVEPKPGQKLRGYAIVFQGAREAADIFAASEHIHWCARYQV